MATCVEVLLSTYPRREFDSPHIHFNEVTGMDFFPPKFEVDKLTSTVRTVLPKHKASVLDRSTNVIRFNTDEIPARLSTISSEIENLETKLIALRSEKIKLEKILAVITE